MPRVQRSEKNAKWGGSRFSVPGSQSPTLFDPFGCESSHGRGVSRTENREPRTENRPSLPLDGAWRFAGDVVDDAVHTAHFVHDTAGDDVEDVMGHAGTVAGHESAPGHRPEGQHVLVGAFIPPQGHP